MNSQRLFVQLTVFLLVTIGFGYQANHMVNKFFNYETSTSVSIVNYQPETIIPKMILCFIATNTSKVTKLDQLFNSQTAINNMTIGKVTASNGQCVASSTNQRPPNYTETNFLLKGFYCRSFETFKCPLPSKGVYSCLFKPLFTVEMIVGELPPFFNSELNKSAAFVKLAPYFGDFDGQIRSPVVYFFNLRKNMHSLSLTYAYSVTRLLPPPYDTRCKPYEQQSLTSQYNCFNECIRNRTSKYGYLPDYLMIQKERYMNSSVSRIPYRFVENMPIDDLRKHIAELLTNEYVDTQFSLSIDDFLNVTLRIRDDELVCDAYCSQPDCKTEMITPFGLFDVDEYTAPNISYHNIGLSLFPPNYPVIIVETKPALEFTDFFILLSSCASFWYGFCPLSLSLTISEKVKQLCTKKKKTRRRPTRDVFERRICLVNSLYPHPYFTSGNYGN